MSLHVPRIGREPAPMAADYEALVAEGAVWIAPEHGFGRVFFEKTVSDGTAQADGAR